MTITTIDRRRDALVEFEALCDEWRGRRPSRRAVAEFRRLAGEMAMPGVRVSLAHRALLVELLVLRDGDHCRACGCLLDVNPTRAGWDPRLPLPDRRPGQPVWRATLDHCPISRRQGGRTRLDNLRLLCQPCNGARGSP